MLENFKILMSTKYDVVMDRYKINLIPFITLILQVTMIKAISKLCKYIRKIYSFSNTT